MKGKKLLGALLMLGMLLIGKAQAEDCCQSGKQCGKFSHLFLLYDRAKVFAGPMNQLYHVSGKKSREYLVFLKCLKNLYNRLSIRHH